MNVKLTEQEAYFIKNAIDYYTRLNFVDAKKPVGFVEIEQAIDWRRSVTMKINAAFQWGK